MRRLLVNSLAVLGLIFCPAIAGDPPECGRLCRDAEGHCSGIPCPVVPGSCIRDSECCEGQVCRPGCYGPTTALCVPALDPGEYEWAWTADCAGRCVPIPEPTGPRGYTIQDVGSFGGGESAANGINNLSQVVGEASRRAFSWRPGDIRLTDITGANWTYARKINNAGQVLINDAFLREIGGGFLLAGVRPYGTALNDLGHVVGRVWNRDDQEYHGALWVDYAQPIDLSVETGEFIITADINNHGQIVGSLRTPQGSRGFLLEDGILTVLVTLDGLPSGAYSINDLGHIAGYVRVPEPSVPPSYYHKPVVWRDKTIEDLDALAGRRLYSAITINNCGEVLTSRGLFHPLYGAKNTEELFPAEDLWFGPQGMDLNDYGEIVGWGLSHAAGNLGRGFYMRPTPGDLFPDGNIDLNDMTMFAHHWANKLCLRTDVNRDGVSDLGDFGRFQIVFGTTTLLSDKRPNRARHANRIRTAARGRV